jgi:hydrogenase maturation protease
MDRMRTIIVGIGNPILGDDGVGIHVIRKLGEKISDPDIALEEAYTGGLNLLDLIKGYERAIMVDAISAEEMEIGEVCKVDVHQMATTHSSNPHDVSFPEALDLARKMGDEDVPEEIILIGINIVPTLEFNDTLSENVARAVPIAIEKVMDIL